MTDINKTRQLHRLLDKVADSQVLDSYDIAHLRATLPELPKQKTLEEITDDVCKAWIASSGDEWVCDSDGSEISLEGWLEELHKQLKGLKCEAVPGLPAGMRLADHEDYGRVVVSPNVNTYGRYLIFSLDFGMSTGSVLRDARPDSLTFIDEEPAHPEFLETEEDYENAPFGTIVVGKNYYPWTKAASTWLAYGAEARNDFDMGACRRYVLRWGDGE